MNVETLHPQQHEPPPGWPQDVYDSVVAAIARGLVNAYRRDHERAERPA